MVAATEMTDTPVTDSAFSTEPLLESHKTLPFRTDRNTTEQNIDSLVSTVQLPRWQTERREAIH